MTRLKLTKEEANKMLSQIEKKREELRELGRYKASAAENEGDAWHDNFAFEQTEIRERALIKEITDLQLQYSKAEIINIDIEKEKSNGKVSIGSKVTILMNFGDETDEETFTLTGGFGNIEDNVISINSPLGRCIIDKPLGYEGSYKVKENTIKVKILSIDN